MKKLAFLILLVTSPAFAADTTHYINTDCPNNGDGTASSCAASGGAAGAWKTCAQMVTGEVAAQANLTTRGGNLIIMASGVTADGSCTIDNFTGMDSTHLLRLVGNYPGGAWNTSYYRLTSVGRTLKVFDPYVEIDRVQAETTGTGSGTYSAISSDLGEGGLYLKLTNSFARFSNCNTGGGGDCKGVVWAPNVASANGIFINNVVLGDGNTNIHPAVSIQGGLYNNGTTMLVLANTVSGGEYGFQFHGGGGSETLTLKNNVVNGASSGKAYGDITGYETRTTSNNVSDDTTSPDASYRSKSCSFTSTTFATPNMHLLSGDTNCKNAGADLTSNGVTTDIDGDSRPQGGTYDIGADEVTATGTVLRANCVSGGSECRLGSSGNNSGGAQ